MLKYGIAFRRIPISPKQLELEASKFLLLLSNGKDRMSQEKKVYVCEDIYRGALEKEISDKSLVFFFFSFFRLLCWIFLFAEWKNSMRNDELNINNNIFKMFKVLRNANGQVGAINSNFWCYVIVEGSLTPETASDCLKYHFSSLNLGSIAWFTVISNDLQSRTKHLERSKEIQLGLTELENFVICFCILFDCYYQSFIRRRRAGY